MRAEELPGWLTAMGVRDVGVRVGEESDRCWCVRPVPGREAEGLREAGTGEEPGTTVEEVGTWEVFWVEQGGRYEWVRFADEATACFALFGRLVWAHAVHVEAAREHAERARVTARDR